MESHDKNCWRLTKMEVSQHLADVAGYLHTVFVDPDAHNPHVSGIGRPWIESLPRQQLKVFWRFVHLSNYPSWWQIVSGRLVLDGCALGLKGLRILAYGQREGVSRTAGRLMLVKNGWAILVVCCVLEQEQD